MLDVVYYAINILLKPYNNPVYVFEKLMLQSNHTQKSTQKINFLRVLGISLLKSGSISRREFRITFIACNTLTSIFFFLFVFWILMFFCIDILRTQRVQARCTFYFREIQPSWPFQRTRKRIAIMSAIIKQVYSISSFLLEIQNDYLYQEGTKGRCRFLCLDFNRLRYFVTHGAQLKF